MSRVAGRRRGFSLIELLVVIAVISILMGLLLPAVQKTREAANRTRCANNLKQISLACHNYENANRRFPPSRIAGETQSWAWIILPYLEQENLYKKWPLGTPAFLLNNPEILNSSVPQYYCPSRRSPGDTQAAGFNQPSPCTFTLSVPGTVGDYAAAIGTTGFDEPTNVKVNNVAVTLPPNGAFVSVDGLTSAAFTDGLSHTLYIGEKHVPAGQFGVFPYDCNLYDGHNIMCSTRSAGPGFPIARAPDDTRLLFGGPHFGVCLFAFADGSVKPVRNSIDEVALGLLSHRADGQPQPADY
jgi:prepilin-type N-terminal cleavage/methylation domain-containing protein